jgi:pyrroline-5-carboxylate reductase
MAIELSVSVPPVALVLPLILCSVVNAVVVVQVAGSCTAHQSISAAPLLKVMGQVHLVPPVIEDVVQALTERAAFCQAID